MPKYLQNVEKEFDLMVNYQIIKESKSVIVENSVKDKHQYSLCTLLEPYPTYDEYKNGNDFDEDRVIFSSSLLSEIKGIQEERRSTLKVLN